VATLYQEEGKSFADDTFIYTVYVIRITTGMYRRKTVTAVLHIVSSRLEALIKAGNNPRSIRQSTRYQLNGLLTCCPTCIRDVKLLEL
jgi:hypothetical protein